MAELSLVIGLVWRETIKIDQNIVSGHCLGADTTRHYF